MPKEIVLQVLPHVAADKDLLKEEIAVKMAIDPQLISYIHILKKSIDARQRTIWINIKANVYFDEIVAIPVQELPNFETVTNNREVVIIGAGPAGLFAALKAIELGLKPILLERGKDVRARRRDLKIINQDHIVNPDSNYCFGEGGAGTYSDGKLYTRSDKRGHIKKVLELFVAFGASPEVLVDAHPHIGTNKLPAIIANIRNFIIEHGGKVFFESKVVDFVVANNTMKAVVLANGDRIDCDAFLLATGHSARDIFKLLDHKNILIEAKPFALGVRVEHPQSFIDKVQYKSQSESRSPYLPPAPYSLVKQVGGRGVYSFCMCPGGIIAPCATVQDEVVTNGWSPSKRDQPYANSGIVVEIRLEDIYSSGFHGSLAAMNFQRAIEHKAWVMAGESQRVPAQRLVDFLDRRITKNMPPSSYTPGTTSVALSDLFPSFIYESLYDGLRAFGTMMKGFIHQDAVLHAPESRTSSPVRIPRDPLTMQHTVINGLYPCGEGAGYAGGILSAAMDGENCMIAIANHLKNSK